MDTVNKLIDDLTAIPERGLSAKSKSAVDNAVGFLERLLVSPGYRHEIYTADAAPYEDWDEDSEWDYDG